MKRTVTASFAVALVVTLGACTRAEAPKARPSTPAGTASQTAPAQDPTAGMTPTPAAPDGAAAPNPTATLRAEEGALGVTDTSGQGTTVDGGATRRGETSSTAEPTAPSAAAGGSGRSGTRQQRSSTGASSTPTTSSNTTTSRPQGESSPAGELVPPASAGDARAEWESMSQSERDALVARYRSMSPSEQAAVRKLVCQKYGVGC